MPFLIKVKILPLLSRLKELCLVTDVANQSNFIVIVIAVLL